MEDGGLGRRVGLALLVLLVTITSFRVIGVSVDPTQAHVLRTPLDDRIPFLPWSVHLYSWVYTSMLLPLFVIRRSELFERVLLAYSLVIVVSLATFALYPVTALGFRPDVSHLDGSSFTNWGVQLTFFVDPPTNLFPSLHVSIATIAVLGTWKARRLFGIIVTPVAIGILLSISTMKQHYVVDGLAGMLLAVGAYALVVRPYRPGPEQRPLAYGWIGPALYVLSHLVVYLFFYLLFRAGVRPWAA